MARVFIKTRKDTPQLRFSLAVITLIAFFALFSFFRLLLLCFNYELFQESPLSQILYAFLNGLRFDFATIAILVLPAVFMMVLPVRFISWLKFWTTFLIFEFILITATLSANFIYFGYVKRHMGEELLSLGNDISFIIGYIFGPMFFPALILVLACIGLIWLKNKVLNILYAEPYFKGIKELGLYFIFIALFLVGVYGGKTSKPLNIPDAYTPTENSNIANLSLNGIFTSYNILTKSNYIAENEMDLNEALDEAVEYLILPAEEVEKPYSYPLTRSKKYRAPIKPNVVVVVMESWVPQYIDAVEGTSYGVTPVFDNLIKKGMYFDNFYAFELRSLPGIGAILASAPAMPKMPKLGYGLEKAGLTKLPEILKEHGYRTIFAQTSKRNSFNLCDTALNMGFAEAYGMEDMPQQFDYVKQEGYGYDYDMYHMLSQKLEGQKEPFFLFAFTGITHIPYLGNLEGFNKYPNTTEENKYLNSLHYADYSIGYFLEQAKKQGWFNNTIFIFVADHTFNRKGSLKEKYNIPMLIYGPWYVQPKRVSEVGSQLDILPTIFELLRLSGSYTAAGKSLFAQDTPRAALFADGYTIGLITQDGALRHTRAKTLETEKYTDNFDAEKTAELLLSLDKTIYTLFKEGRWQDPQDDEEENK